MADGDDDGEDASGSNLPAYKPGNLGPDGSYLIGKGRPPEAGKFRAGDGRKRGRRPKGTKNLDTDFAEELASTITVSVNGKPTKMTKQRGMIVRLIDNAMRGQNPAILAAINFSQRFTEEQRRRGVEASDDPDQAILDNYILRRLAQISGEDEGDPLPDEHSNDDQNDKGDEPHE